MGAKAVRTDDTEVQESEESSGTKTEKPMVGESSLYLSDGSFIPWDDLGIDVETDYTLDNYDTEAKSPYKVFNDHKYNRKLVFPDNITSIGECAFYGCTSLTNINYAGTMEEWNAYDTHNGLWSLWDSGSVIETITCSDGVITL